MQSQPRNLSVSFERSRTDPSVNTAPSFKGDGRARTSRMTGVSPLSSSLGTSVWPRFPDPPVSSTFMVFSPASRVELISIPDAGHYGRPAVADCRRRFGMRPQVDADNDHQFLRGIDDRSGHALGPAYLHGPRRRRRLPSRHSLAARGRASAVRAGLRHGRRHWSPCDGQSRAAQAGRRRAGKAHRAARMAGAGGNTVGRLRRPPTEYDLTLRQADQARADFAVIEDGIELIMAQVAKVPKRKELAWVA